MVGPGFGSGAGRKNCTHTNPCRVFFSPGKPSMTNPPANALQRLIRARMRELNRSYADVARIGGLPRSTLHHLATHDRPVRRLPNPATLQGLAAGLDLSLEVVRTAAASAGGFIVDEEHV